VRGDHGEVVQLLVSNGAKLYKKKEGGLVELRVSRLSGCTIPLHHHALDTILLHHACRRAVSFNLHMPVETRVMFNPANCCSVLCASA
jgi:hypothetical protein